MGISISQCYQTNSAKNTRANGELMILVNSTTRENDMFTARTLPMNKLLRHLNMEHLVVNTQEPIIKLISTRSGYVYVATLAVVFI